MHVCAVTWTQPMQAMQQQEYPRLFHWAGREVMQHMFTSDVEFTLTPAVRAGCQELDSKRPIIWYLEMTVLRYPNGRGADCV